MIHKINTLKFEVTCPSEEDAFALRTDLSNSVAGEVSSALDAACAGHIGEEEWILIDSLEIDLGSFTTNSFLSEFPVILRKQLEQELAKALGSRPLRSSRYQGNQSLLTLVSTYLQTGTLLWWGESLGKSIDTLIKELLEEEPEAFCAFLLKHRTISPIWERLSLQLTDATKQQIVAALPELRAIAEVVVSLVQRRNSNAPLSTIDTSAEYLHAPIIISEDLRSKIAAIVLREALSLLSSSNTDSRAFELIKKLEPQLPSDQAAPVTIVSPPVESVLASASGVSIKPEHITFAQQSNTTLLSEDKSVIQSTDPSQQTNSIVEPSIMDALSGGKYIVRHAGLAILAPFLKPFFTHTGLLKDSKWESTEARHRGAHLLYYLATGMQYPPEHELILEKVFCGIPLEEAVPRMIELTAAELSECESLLRAIIEHWSVIKNASIAGLRESFLLRDGMLTRKSNDWRLVVERKTLDVLVDRIPWGFSTIGFPWNRYLIFVEW